MHGVGQTQNLIDNLPDERCMVVVAKHQQGRFIRNKIEEERGNNFAKKIKISVIENDDDMRINMNGYSNLIFFDCSFFDSSPKEIIEKALDHAHSAAIVYQRSKNK